MKTQKLVLAAFFVAITAIFSQVIIPIPISPVPLSLSLLAVFLTGTLLEKKQAFLAQVSYILLGAFGAPVFTGFRGGVGMLVGPTGGYLAAYPIMVFLIAWTIERYHKKPFLYSVFGMTLALIVCYLLGTMWLVVFTKMAWREALLAGVLPFILLDIVKIFAAASLSIPLRKAIRKIS